MPDVSRSYRKLLIVNIATFFDLDQWWGADFTGKIGKLSL